MLDPINENTDAQKSVDVGEVENEETTTAKKSSQEEKVKEDENKKAMDEIDESLAEDSVSDKEETTIDEVDYSKLDLDELVVELEKLIKNHPIQSIKNQVEAVRSTFSERFGKMLAKKKAEFLESGGNSIDFQFSSPTKTAFNSLISEYRKKRDQFYGDLEKQYADNLEKKLKVIEDLKILIVEAEPATMYKKFKELQKTWHAAGPIPKNQYNDTWRTYQHHVERFYDLLNLSNDYRDIDFQNNLDEKLLLIKRVEDLQKEDDINFAFKELQKIHKTWKEDVGPVAKELREEIWQKFSSATKKIHDRRHEFYKKLKSKHSEMIDAKLKVVEEINNYDFSKNNSHNDWQKSIKDIEALRQKYFDIGKLPYSKSEAVWQKFKEATKKFNKAKNNFYKREKSGQQENLNKKLELIDLAESLKDSEDWEITTETFKKIQSDWKKIGHVPRKFSDDIWKKFKAACNHYFDRYYTQKNELSKKQLEVVDAKKTFLEELKKKKEHTKESILAAMNDWRKLGNLPRNARQVDTDFNKLIDKVLAGLSVDKEEVALLKFRNIVDGYVANNDTRKLESELSFLRKKIDEIEKEAQQLENNLSFFSDDSGDNPLVNNVKTKIERYKEDASIWKEKLSYLRTLDF